MRDEGLAPEHEREDNDGDAQDTKKSPTEWRPDPER